MTLTQLLKTHSVDVHALTQTRDDYGHTRETIGAKLAALDCRFMPLQVAEQLRYEQQGLNRTHRAQFSADPSLTLNSCLVYGGQVYRVREIGNMDGLGWSWIATLEHIPQAEQEAP